MPGLKIRRALISVSDKRELVPLGKALNKAGAELVATGRTADTLRSAGLPVIPIEQVSGSPEAFQGRMKTLSFPVCSGILYRRGDEADELDLRKLSIPAIDCVVVNFYPFEAAAARPGITPTELIEEVDIGGPTLVRAAAKNIPHVLVLTDPGQYGDVIHCLGETGRVNSRIVERCAHTAWERVLSYDAAIARELGGRGRRPLRYGENPHQKGLLEFDPSGPIAWDESLTPTELSYNNILDVSNGYALGSDLIDLSQGRSTGVVILKHNNPCGVTLVPEAVPHAQKVALTRAWEGDSVSAFGSVVVFTDPIEVEVAEWLSEHFIELVAAPDLTEDSAALKTLAKKRRGLKALRIRRFGELPPESITVVPGGRLFQTADLGFSEIFKCVTRREWPRARDLEARFGIAVARALKSNSLAIVRELPGVSDAFQLVGTGQGQPNRIEALEKLAIPRAQAALRSSGGRLSDCLLVSDAFFPFRDSVDAAYHAGLRFIVQPGGSIKDQEIVDACDEHGMSMIFTGIRHFRH